jgi:tetratricopeptide (TPR) repeat protein
MPDGFSKIIDATLGRFKKPSGWAKSGSANKRATKCVERGRKLYNDNAYGAAIEEFRQALTVDPKYQRAMYYLANASYKTKEFPQARRYWEQCILADPTTKFADLSIRRLQHLDKAARKGNSDLDDFYRQMGAK